MSRFGALVEISHAMVAQQNKRTFTPTGKQPGESRTRRFGALVELSNAMVAQQNSRRNDL